MSRKFSHGSCRIPLFGSALALALAVGDLHALGLGGLRVQSALNQPFVGEIALLDVKPDELDTVKVQIASAEEFSKAGSERYHYLSRLRFTPQISPRGETVIRVSSREPIREPYMDFLVEVNWPKGRLLKGYTVLLDPPVTDGRRPARIEPPVAQPRGSATRPAVASSADVAPPTSRKQQAASPPAPPSPAPVPAGLGASADGFPKQIGPVPRGFGLWRLSSRHAPAGATAAQTAMALYRNNQDAFVNGDINRLRVGRTLTIPSAAELFALGPDAAQREFAAALRGERVRRSPIAEATPPGLDSESRLKIAGAATEAPAPSVLDAPDAKVPETVEQELLLVRETSESTRQETAELRDRIRELEGQLGEIQRLLQLRNAELARIQGAERTVVRRGEAEAPVQAAGLEEGRASPGGDSLRPESQEAAEASADRALEEALAASGAPPGPTGATVPGLSPGAVESVALGIPEVSPSSSPEESTAATAAPSPAPWTAGAETPTGLSGPSQASVESSQGLGAEAPGPAAPTSPGAVSPRAEATRIPVTPEASAGIWAGLPAPWRDLWAPAAGAAGVLVLGIGALAWARARRRRSLGGDELGPESDGTSPEYQRAATSLRVQAVPADGTAGSTDEVGRGSQGEASPSVFTTLGRSEAETDEADVLSEADIYIAYGRYREAEELLREEMERAPGRVELKYKLAESYHGAKNYPALDALMKEMQGTGEDRVYPDRWQRLVDVAKAIEGLERGDAGVRPVASRTTPAIFGLGERAGPRGADVFPLDSSGARDPLGDIASPDDADLAPAAGLDPSIRDVPILRSSRPAPAARDDLDPLSLDLDVLPESLDLDDALAGAIGGGVPRVGGDDEPMGAVSDLELTIDDLRAASDIDLESFVDSTRTVSHLEDEPLSGQGAASVGLGSHPARLRAVTTEGAGDDRVPGGTFYGLEEEGSSDLLSSQWQMDSGLWDEIATKLDLARAYMEMGDQDSAKGILEEVVNEGNEDQRGEATQMLRALG